MKRKHFYSSIEKEKMKRVEWGEFISQCHRKLSRGKKIIQAFLSLCTWPGTIHYHTMTFKPLGWNGTMTIHIFYDRNSNCYFKCFILFSLTRTPNAIIFCFGDEKRNSKFSLDNKRTTKKRAGRIFGFVCRIICGKKRISRFFKATYLFCGFYVESFSFSRAIGSC